MFAKHPFQNVFFNQNQMSLRKFLLLFCLIIEVTLSQSQTNKFDFGINAGAGLVNLRGSETFNEKQNSMIGYTGEFFFQYNFKKIISIHTGIAGELKGSSSKIMLTDQYGNPVDEIKLKTNLFYVTLPVLIRANFGKKNFFFAEAGAYTAYLINNSTSDPSGIQITNYVPLKDLDFGISCGLGFSIPIKSKSAFSMEIRYSLGLYDINANAISSYYEIIKTNSLLMMLAYSRKFGFRDKEGN